MNFYGPFVLGVFIGLLIAISVYEHIGLFKDLKKIFMKSDKKE